MMPSFFSVLCCHTFLYSHKDFDLTIFLELVCPCYMPVISIAMRFSFWMANNAPFTENERLELLKIHSVLERLIVIWKAVERLSQRECDICCSQCKTRFTKVTDIFTVGGADGTTAAYVNNYGTVHQITTMRTIDEREVLFEGRPSTDNRYVYSVSHDSFVNCCGCLEQRGLYSRVHSILPPVKLLDLLVNWIPSFVSS
jgi:hypothetical protein